MTNRLTLYSFDGINNYGSIDKALKSVELRMPTELDVSPPIAEGPQAQITVSKKDQNQNLVYASPTVAPGPPTFRSLSVNDLPGEAVDNITVTPPAELMLPASGTGGDNLVLAKATVPSARQFYASPTTGGGIPGFRAIEEADITTFTKTLAQVLANGNTTGANDIIIDALQKLVATGNVNIGIFTQPDNTTTGTNNILVGYNNTANGNQGVVIGVNAVSGGDNGIAIGTNASNAFPNSVAIGNGANTTVLLLNSVSIAIGPSSNADSESVSIGETATAAQYSVSVGNDAEANSNSVAIGYNAVTDLRSVAVGSSAEAFAENAVAIGEFSKANFDNSVAIGKDCETTALGQIAIGKNIGDPRSSVYAVECRYNTNVLGYLNSTYQLTAAGGIDPTALPTPSQNIANPGTSILQIINTFFDDATTPLVSGNNLLMVQTQRSWGTCFTVSGTCNNGGGSGATLVFELVWYDGTTDKILASQDLYLASAATTFNATVATGAKSNANAGQYVFGRIINPTTRNLVVTKYRLSLTRVN